MKSNRLMKAAIVSTFNFQSRKMLTKIEVEEYKLDSNDVWLKANYYVKFLRKYFSIICKISENKI